MYSATTTTTKVPHGSHLGLSGQEDCRQGSGVQLPILTDVAVTPKEVLLIVLALTMPGQPNLPSGPKPSPADLRAWDR